MIQVEYLVVMKAAGAAVEMDELKVDEKAVRMAAQKVHLTVDQKETIMAA